MSINNQLTCVVSLERFTELDLDHHELLGIIDIMKHHGGQHGKTREIQLE